MKSYEKSLLDYLEDVVYKLTDLCEGARTEDKLAFEPLLNRYHAELEDLKDELECN